MFTFRHFLFAILFTGSTAGAASSGSGIGLNVGLGLPFVTQAGVNWRITDKFGLALGYNMLSLSAGSASSKLTMPEVLVHVHPFSGSFYVAAGAGQEALNVTAKDAATSAEVAIDVKAMTTILKIGWMWGVSDGGFWFGMDASQVSPSGAETTITAPGVPTTSQEYQDAVDAGKKFGETAYTNITFARFGWIF